METLNPTTLETHAAWVMVVGFALSLVYEFWRTRIGTSRHDSLRVLVTQGLPFYGSAAVVIWLLFAGAGVAAWVGLIYSIILIGVSIFYYNPHTMLERNPGWVDWFEDLVYTGLLFVTAALLAYEVSGATLSFS